MQPSLSLSYASRSGNGHFGVGWSLGGLSAIARCPQTWAQNGAARDVRNDMADRFCLDGNQLRLVAGTYGGAGAEYRTEIETFARIKSYGAAGNGPAYFIVEHNNGLIYEYGNTASSRIESIGQSTARAWAVNTIRDRAGNAVLFNYSEDATNGSFRIDNIQYTQNTNTALTADYLVSFVYESVPVGEVDSSYLANSRIKRITRASRIDITHDTALVHRYVLAYEPLSSTSRSRLGSIQECGGSVPDCLAPTTFTYQNGTAGLSAEVDTGISLPPTKRWVADVNGDGRQDLVYSSSETAGTLMVAFANSSGGYNAAVNTGIASTNWAGAVLIDYNADGRQDFLVPYSGNTWWVILGTTTGLAAPTNTGIAVTSTGTGANARALDIDGDGLQDLVWADLVGYAGGDAIRYRLRVWGGTFSSTVSTLVGPLPVNEKISQFFGFPEQRSTQYTPDFNGDGRGDVSYTKTTRVMLDEFGTWKESYSLQVVPAGGSSFGASLQKSTAHFFGDFNGDGFSDLLYNRQFGGLYVRFSTGTSFTSELTVNPSAYDWPILVMDWDGDGYDDILLLSTSTGRWNLLRSTGEAFATIIDTGLTGGPGAVTDLNGDGLWDTAYYSFGTWRYRTHLGSQPDVLLTATDGFGLATMFNYVALTQGNYTKHADAVFPEQDYQGPTYVVGSVTSSTGITSPATYTQNFWYWGARVNLQGRGSEGFYAQRVQDTRNNLYTYNYFKREYPYTGAVFQSDTFQPDGSTLVSRTQNTWTAHSYGTGSEVRKLPYISQTTVYGYEVGGAYDGVRLSTAVTTNAVDATTGTPYDTTTTVTEEAGANGVQAGAWYVQRVYHPTVYFITDTTNW